MKLSRTSLGLCTLAGLAGASGTTTGTSARDLAFFTAGAAVVFFAAGLVFFGTGWALAFRGAGAAATAASATVAAASAVTVGLLTVFGMRLECSGLGVLAM